MREIKFRAWDIHTKKMWQWEEHNAFTIDPGSIKQWFTNSDLRVMQFTGLKDKNGKEIYEGDIIDYDDLDCGLTHTEGIVWVVYNNDTAGFGFTDDDEDFNTFDLFSSCQPHDSSEHIEVIGNIYENKELLK